MTSMSSSDILAQIPNLDDASKAEINKVLTEETRKAELQGSTHPSRVPRNFGFQNRRPHLSYFGRLTVSRYSQAR